MDLQIDFLMFQQPIWGPQGPSLLLGGEYYMDLKVHNDSSVRPQTVERGNAREELLPGQANHRAETLEKKSWTIAIQGEMLEKEP